MPRQDDDVEIPSLTLDQDEVSDRQSNSQTTKRRLAPASSKAKPIKEAIAQPQVQYKKPNLFGVYLLLFVFITAASVAAFLVWQDNQRLKAELAATNTQLTNLDHQLLAADVSANEQDVTVEETLKNHNSEIRKLWGVSYDTNRKAIKANTTKVASIDKKQSDLRESLATQGKLVAVQGEAVNDIEANYHTLLGNLNRLEQDAQTRAFEVDAMREEQDATGQALSNMGDDTASLIGKVSQQNSQIDNLLNTIKTMQSNNQSVSKQVTDLTSTLATIEESIAQINQKIDTLGNDQPAIPSNLQAQLKDHQEAINAIDAFRIQVNGKLNRIDTQVNQIMLEQQLSAEP
ncbi:hypothetical protein MED121_03778 [Marinomonas sp. MED121]|uniref:hypothetical protein n=1 Tax=Marinomonas sp. MED121 TaxID=314277 RepID=UPI000068FAAD|nr:hypothetical protein [Marinomonas sp. MED121]EAQ63859.1 hypothetical protein MED121_03778 [Marinomonas sp. MED121]